MKKYRKAIAATAAAVVGIAALFGVDASEPVERVSQAVLVLLPLVVYRVPNE